MLTKGISMFLLGGSGYVIIELLYRGRSHFSMFFAGGLCFLLLGQLEKRATRLSSFFRALLGAGMITGVELAAGLLFNRDFRVWDYRGLPGNLWGQICPRFFLLWIPLAWVAGKIYTLAERQMRWR